MADSRPLIAKIQVEHSGAAKGGRTSTSTEEQNTKVNKAIHSSSEENTQENKKSNLFLEKLHKVGKFQLLRFLGINLALHTLVKQSAVYTSVLGALFQMLGALIDMILAPLLPMLIPFLRSFAQNLPGIAAKITSVLEWIGGKFVDFYNFSIRVWPFMEKIWNFLGGTLKYWIVGLIIARMGGFHAMFIAWSAQLIAMLALNFGKLFAFLYKNSLGKMFGAGGGKNKVAGVMTIAANVVNVNSAAGLAAGGSAVLPGQVARAGQQVPKTAGRMAMMSGGAMAFLSGAGGILIIVGIVSAVIAYLGIKAIADRSERFREVRQSSFRMVDSNGNDIPDAGQLRNAQKEELVYNWIESMANDGSIR